MDLCDSQAIFLEAKPRSMFLGTFFGAISSRRRCLRQDCVDRGFNSQLSTVYMSLLKQLSESDHVSNWFIEETRQS
jgi:hypothetical protein